MSHESTVGHEDFMGLSDEELETTQLCPRSRSVSDVQATANSLDRVCTLKETDLRETVLLNRARNKSKEKSQETANLPRARAETPKKLTHHHDEDDSDESSTGSDEPKPTVSLSSSPS